MFSEPETPLTIALVSLGCPKNLVDSEWMLALLAGEGMIVGAPMDDADVIVINTCGFLEAARQESLEVISEALAHKRRGRTRRVVVAGCLVNRDALDLPAPADADALAGLFDWADGVDAIVGVNNRSDIVRAVRGEGRWAGVDPCPAGPAASDAGRFRLTPRHTAYLRISEGCSHRCTFCTIPAIRGPFRSKTPDDVLAEARELIADGAVELNVIAQDTTAYGSDHPAAAARDLAWLLRRLDALAGLRWLRLLYTYPLLFSDRLIAAVAECERVVPYVDMPLQHISTGVLRRMGRRVSGDQVRELLCRLRRDIPSLVLRTTLMTGFPGESDADFAELLDFVKEFRFDALGVFAFSGEPPAPAAAMGDQVPDDVKAARAEAIMLAQQEIAFANNRAAVGREVEILVDGVGGEGYCIGRHYGQAPDVDGLCIVTDPRPAGSFVSGKVVDWRQYDLVVEPR